MKIGVLVAMDSEYRQLAGLLRDGRLGGNEIALVKCGIGKVNAALGVAGLIDRERPDAVVSVGVAGGTDPARAGVMDVVVGAETAYHDVDCGPGNEPGQVQGLPPRFAADPRLLAAALALCGETKCVAGLIATGDRFVSSPGDLAAVLRIRPDALAVDMESAAIAQVCHIRAVPFISFRIVSDIPGTENHFSAYADFWTRLADASFAAARDFLLSLA